MPLVNCIVPAIQLPQKPGVITMINGRPIKNLLKNSNFVSNTEYWHGFVSDISASDNVLSVVGNGYAGIMGAFQTVDVLLPTSNKFYFRANLMVTDAVCQSAILQYRGSDTGFHIIGTLNTPTQNQWYTLSTIALPVTTMTGNLRFCVAANYENSETQNGKVLQLMEIMAVNIADLSSDMKSMSDEDLKSFLDTLPWFNDSIII